METVGSYCHRCGQDQSLPVLSLRGFAARFSREHLSLDNRLARTLGVLIARPGRLTKAYATGRFVRYVSPTRLYLLLSVAYVSVLALADTNVFFGILYLNEDVGPVYREWLPRVLIGLMPLFALLVAGLHPRSGRTFVEHLVFSVHFHAFYFIDAIVLALLRRATGTNSTAVDPPLWAVVPDIALQLAPLVYLYLALRRVYGNAWWAAGPKAVVLEVLYLLAIGLTGDAAVAWLE